MHNDHNTLVGCPKAVKTIVRALSHLTTAIQIFDVVSMSSEMGCIVTNVTVRT